MLPCQSPVPLQHCVRAGRELTEHGDLELLRDGLELLERFGSGLAEVDNDLPDLDLVLRLCDACTRRSRQSSARPRSRGRDPEGCALSSSPRVASLLWLRPMRTMLRPDLAICLANSRPMSPVGPVMAARRSGREAERRRFSSGHSGAETSFQGRQTHQPRLPCQRRSS